MSNRLVFAVFSCAALGLAACAPQPKPMPVRPQPVFDKMGNVGCTDSSGRVVMVPGTAKMPDYLPPCQELCHNGPLMDATGKMVDPCTEPPRGGGGEDNGSRKPTTSSRPTLNPTTGAPTRVP